MNKWKWPCGFPLPREGLEHSIHLTCEARFLSWAIFSFYECCILSGVSQIRMKELLVDYDSNKNALRLFLEKINMGHTHTLTHIYTNKHAFNF